MPYIAAADKQKFNEIFDEFDTLVSLHDMPPGELNYLFTVLAIMFTEQKGVSYTNMNEVMGVFESAKLEYYRRMVAPYEDEKIKENGDVY